MLNSLETDLAQWFRPWPSAAGLHLAGILNHGLSAKAVAESAARLGVKVEHFGQDSLALGYGAIESSLITEGIRRLRRAIKNVALTDSSRDL